MIHDLKLTNFKQHQALEIDFTHGLNVIQGDNGAGKSTILKAILYALFGASAAGKKEHLATWGSNDKMEVILTATIAGRTLTILRGFDKATTHCSDDLLAAGHTPCTKFIEQELGLDYKTFKHLLYAAQGETQALLKLGAADLQRKIEVITKIDGIDKVVGLIADDLQIFVGKLSVLPEVCNLKELSSELTALEEVEQAKILHIGDQEKMTAQLKAVLEKKLHELKNEIAPAVQKARETKAAHKALSTSLSQVELDLTSHAETKPATCSKMLQTEQLALVDYIKKSKVRLDKASTAAKDLNRLAKGLDSAEEDLNTFTGFAYLFEERNLLWNSVQSAERQYSAIAEQYAELLQIEADCPSCGRAFDEDVSRRHEAKILVLKAELDKAKALMQAASKPWSEFKRDNTSLLDTDFHAMCKKLSDVFSEFSASYGNAKLNPDLMSSNEFSTLTNAVDEAVKLQGNNNGKLQLVQRWEQVQDSLISQLCRAKKSLSELDMSGCAWTEQGLAEAEANIAELQKEYQSELDFLSSSRYALKEVQAKKAVSLKEFLAAQSADKQRKELEVDQAQRKELQTYLRSNRARLMSDTWGNITNLTGAYTNDITEGLLHSLNRDTAGDFTISEGVNTVPVSELSGGRQSIVGLSLRMALGQTFFGGNSFLLLDEVSADLTDENAASVAGFLSGLGTQVIMVSHRSGEASNACNVIVL